METLTAAIVKFDNAISAFIALAIILIVCYLFYSRSGSTYSLYHRLWSLLIGEKTFHDPALESYMQERRDLDKFNATFNTKIATKNELNRFLAWINKYDIEIKRISDVKGNFNFHKLKLEKPSRIITTAAFACTIGIFLFALFIGLIGVSNKALLRFHPDEPWMLIDHKMAKPLFDRHTITPKSCNDKNLSREKMATLTGLAPATVTTICHSFDSKEDAQAIDNFVRKQQSLPFVALFLIWFSFRLFIFSIRRINARDYRLYFKNKLTGKI